MVNTLALLPDAPAGGHAVLAFGMPGGSEWIILLILGLLIFGRRLPEVGRSLGRGIVEFKRGIKGIEDEIDEESNSSGPPRTKQMSSGSSARLAEPSSSGSEKREASQVRVGGEGENPYAPGDEPRSNG